ncbi:MAG: TonB-dependent receptor [Candidatus Zixiibacteriota bacterium]
MRLNFWHQIQTVFLTAVWTALFPAIILSQSNIKLDGYVFDNSNGIAIVGANLVIEGTGYRVVSDSRGYFRFTSIPIGEYSLTVSSIGYISESREHITLEQDVTTQVNIFLERETYYLGKIKVIADQRAESSENLTVIFRDDIDKSNARTTSDILRQIPGVYIQQGSVSGGKSQIRIRGCDPNQVLVLLDGHKINQSGNGEADLSSIPVDMIERIEVHKGGGSARYGADALGGVINIISHKNILSKKFSARVSNIYGKWDARNSGLIINDLAVANNISMKLSYNHNSSTGDFPFKYTTGKRQTVIQGSRYNNELTSDNYFISGLVQFNQRFNLSYSGQVYRSEQGLPDRADRQDSLSYMKDKRYIISANFKYLFNGEHTAQLELGYSKFQQGFIGISAPVPFNSKYDNDIMTARYSHRLNPIRNNQIYIGTEYRRDVLNHRDILFPDLSMKDTYRDNISVFIDDMQKFDIIGWVLFDRISLNGAVRFDYSRTAKDSTSYKDESTGNLINHLSPGIGITIKKGDKLNYQIRANYSKSFRLPSLNAIFWKTDVRSEGNPGLKPELSESSEIGLSLAGTFGSIDIGCEISYFHTTVKDLIVWIPIQNAWQPMNNDRASIFGREDLIRLSLFDNLFVFKYQNSLTTARNKTDNHTVMNKELPFYPHYMTVFSAQMDYGIFYAAYSSRLVGKAFINSANTDFYPGYSVDDMTIGLNFKISSLVKISTDYRLSNMSDENYLLMSNFPMPGRDWSVGFRLSYGGDN